MFNPEIFQFKLKGTDYWESSGSNTGSYSLYRYRINLPEVDTSGTHTNNDSNDRYSIYIEDRPIYKGRIPSNDFAFELFKNMDLSITIIQRENRIGEILE